VSRFIRIVESFNSLDKRWIFLVVGLAVSAHRDAVPVIRMQPDVQNLGHAAGMAAAMAAKSGYPTRQIDLRAIQQELVKVGSLPADVLTHKDSYPLPADRVAAAVRPTRKSRKKGARRSTFISR